MKMFKFFFIMYSMIIISTYIVLCMQGILCAETIEKKSSDGKFVAILIPAPPPVPDGKNTDNCGLLIIKEINSGKTLFISPTNEPKSGFRGAEAHLPADPRYVKNFSWNPKLPILVFDCSFFYAAMQGWEYLSSIGVYDCNIRSLIWVAGLFHNWRKMYTKYGHLEKAAYAPIWLDHNRIIYKPSNKVVYYK